MTEAVVAKVEEPKVEAPVVEEVTPEVSPVEQQALEQGWVPQDQWQGDPDAWRPAKEFVERGELYKSIHSTKRELKQTQAALQAQMRHHQYVFEKAYTKALTELRQEKRQAMKDQDFDRMEAVETQIEQLQTERQQEAASLTAAQQAVQAPAVVPEFQAFLNKNPWYEMDKDLHLEADLIGAHYMNNGGSKDTLFTHVEGEIKRRFPEKFGIQTQRKVAAPQAVAAVDRTGKKAPKGGTSMSDVPEHMREVVRNFTQASGMSEADYIKQLKEIGAF